MSNAKMIDMRGKSWMFDFLKCLTKQRMNRLQTGCNYFNLDQLHSFFDITNETLGKILLPCTIKHDVRN